MLSRASTLTLWDNRELLDQAEEYRSAEPQRLADTLLLIDEARLQGEQRYQYQFLQAYSAALTGEREKANRMFNHIYLQSDSDLEIRSPIHADHVICLYR